MKEGTREGTSSWDRTRSLITEQLNLSEKPRKNGHPSILGWEKDEKYQTSQTDIGWTQVTVKQMDELALADGIYRATRVRKREI